MFFARVGLTARGIVYLLMGLLAYLLAGSSHVEVDQGSVLDKVFLRPGGRLLVGLIAIGFFCYALWRFFEAGFGVTGEKRGVGNRVISFVRGLIYLSLTVTAVSIYNGSRQHQSTQQRSYAIDILSRPGGRVALGSLGFIIIVVGIAGVYDGLNLKFMSHFQGEKLSSTTRIWISRLGQIGIISRGLVFVIIGSLLVSAAWRNNATKATGLDGALKTLKNEPFGGFLLILVAAGFVIFGIYGLAEARFQDI